MRPSSLLLTLKEHIKANTDLIVHFKYFDKDSWNGTLGSQFTGIKRNTANELFSVEN